MSAPYNSSSTPPPLPGQAPQGGSRRSRTVRWPTRLGISAGILLGLVLLFRFGLPGTAGNSAAHPSRSEPGVEYWNERIAQEPWSIHTIKVDRTRKDIAFYSSHAKGRVLGVGLLAEQARAIPPAIGKAIAGINGDFYLRDDANLAGDPRGLQIVDGELISRPNTVCVWFDGNGAPHLDSAQSNFSVTWPEGRKSSIGLNEPCRGGMAVLYTPTYGPSTRTSGSRDLVLEKAGEGEWLPLKVGRTYRARVREITSGGNTRLVPGQMVLSLGSGGSRFPEIQAGAVLEISTATSSDLSQARAAIAGGPALIENGTPFSAMHPPPEAAQNYSERSKYERHPRSAIGWNDTHFFFVTVDGRQPGLSVGMKLAELAGYMRRLGCTEAMNLDGGKSSQLWMTGSTMNDPCQGDDTVANALFVVRTPGAH